MRLQARPWLPATPSSLTPACFRLRQASIATAGTESRAGRNRLRGADSVQLRHNCLVQLVSLQARQLLQRVPLGQILRDQDTDVVPGPRGTTLRRIAALKKTAIGRVVILCQMLAQLRDHALQVWPGSFRKTRLYERGIDTDTRVHTPAHEGCQPFAPQRLLYGRQLLGSAEHPRRLVMIDMKGLVIDQDLEVTRRVDAGNEV